MIMPDAFALLVVIHVTMIIGWFVFNTAVMLLYSRLNRGRTSVRLKIRYTMFHTCKVDQVRLGQ